MDSLKSLIYSIYKRVLTIIKLLFFPLLWFIPVWTLTFRTDDRILISLKSRNPFMATAFTSVALDSYLNLSHNQ